MATAVVDIFGSRELLWNLTLRELRSRYRRSVLGWTWSLLNPLATMAIYTVVFGIVLRVAPPVGQPSGVHSYGMFLVCGLIPWNFFAQGVATSMDGVIGAAGLVRKVYFPREVLVFASIGSLLVTFVIETSLLIIVLLFFGAMPLPWIPLLVVYMSLLALFTTGLSLIISAANVYFRDLGHLWTIATQIWFYATPIVYPVTLIPDRWIEILKFNPLSLFVETFRDLLYNNRWPSLEATIYLTVGSTLMFILGLWAFRKLSSRFAEEL